MVKKNKKCFLDFGFLSIRFQFLSINLSFKNEFPSLWAPKFYQKTAKCFENTWNAFTSIANRMSFIAYHHISTCVSRCGFGKLEIFAFVKFDCDSLWFLAVIPHTHTQYAMCCWPDNFTRFTWKPTKNAWNSIWERFVCVRMINHEFRQNENCFCQVLCYGFKFRNIFGFCFQGKMNFVLVDITLFSCAVFKCALKIISFDVSYFSSSTLFSSFAKSKTIAIGKSATDHLLCSYVLYVCRRQIEKLSTTFTGQVFFVNRNTLERTFPTSLHRMWRWATEKSSSFSLLSFDLISICMKIKSTVV